MIEALAVIGLLILYVIWLISPIIMMVLFENYGNTPGELVGIVYGVGAIVVGYVLFNFVGIW